MNSSRLCGKCGVPLGTDTLAGLCPQCMFLSALGSEPETPPVLEEEDVTSTPLPTAPVLSRFGDYELLEELAHGGMGVIYKARQVHLDRIVAIKMLLLGQRASDEVVERFKREAQSAARLRHPLIVAIHEVGEVEGQPFFSMDYVQGQDLAQIIRKSPLPARRAATYLRAVAEAIYYAHQQGIIHRDLKPSNILIDFATDEVRVTDFGLAKRMNDDSDLTLSGQVLGSPNHMAPELAAGHHRLASPASDVFSLGAILYDLLTGRPPFLADSIQATLLKIRDTDPVAPRELHAGIPRDLETICLKCLEKEPGARFGSAQELADELGRFLSGEPIRTRPINVFERAWRWCRRNPVEAALAGATGSLLMVITLGAVLAAVRIESARSNEQEHRLRAEALAGQEQEQRLAAQSALRLLEITRARELFERDRAAEGLATLAYLLRQSPREVGLAEWTLFELAVRPFGLRCGEPLIAPGPVFQIEFQPGGPGLALATAAGVQMLADHGDRTRHWLFPPTATESEDPGGWGRDRPATVCYSADGRWLATGGVDGAARVWEVATGQPVSQPFEHPDWVSWVSLSPDRRWLATACRDGRARVWDVAEGRLAVPALLHQKWVNSVSFSPDATLLVTASDDRTARVWRLPAGEPVGTPIGHVGAAKYAEFSPEGSRVLVAGDRTARVCDAGSGRDLIPPLLHEGIVAMARFSPDGTLVVTASLDRSARLWNAYTGKAVGRPMNHGETVRDAVFSPDALRVATASEDRTARLWDARTGEPLSEPMQHLDAVWSVRFSADGTTIVTASSDGTAQVWEALPAVMYGVDESLGRACSYAEWSADGRRGLGVTRGGVALWSGLPGISQHWPKLSSSSPFVHACFSPDGSAVATSTEDGTVQVWSADTRQPAGPPVRHGARVNWVEFSPGGKGLASASSDGSARIWSVGTSAPVTPPLAHAAVVLAARFSPEGRRLATASADRTARLWDAATGEPLAEPLRHDGPLTTVSFSPDGQRLLTASHDGTARLWDARGGQPIGSSLRHGTRVTGAWFSPDGEQVLTTSADHTARLWNCKTGEPMSTPLTHDEPVAVGAFSPDGRRAATGTRAGWVSVWDTATGDRTVHVRLHTFSVNALAFHPDGKWLLSGSSDCRLRITALPRLPGPVPDWLPKLAEAVAQRRRADGRTLQPVPVAALVELKLQLAQDPGRDNALAWGRWILAPRGNRLLSPESDTSIQKLAARRLDYANLKPGSEPRLRDQLEALFPFYRQSSQSLALLARITSIESEWDPQRLKARLDWLSREAVRRNPTNAVAWWSRAIYLNHLGQRDEAIALLLQWAPHGQNSYLWVDTSTLLEDAGRYSEALRTIESAIDVAERAPNWTEGARERLRAHRRQLIERHPELAAP